MRVQIFKWEGAFLKPSCPTVVLFVVAESRGDPDFCGMSLGLQHQCTLHIYANTNGQKKRVEVELGSSFLTGPIYGHLLSRGAGSRLNGCLSCKKVRDNAAVSKRP